MRSNARKRFEEASIGRVLHAITGYMKRRLIQTSIASESSKSNARLLNIHGDRET